MIKNNLKRQEILLSKKLLHNKSSGTLNDIVQKNTRMCTANKKKVTLDRMGTVNTIKTIEVAKMADGKFLIRRGLIT